MKSKMCLRNTDGVESTFIEYVLDQSAKMYIAGAQCGGPNSVQRV